MRNSLPRQIIKPFRTKIRACLPASNIGNKPDNQIGEALPPSCKVSDESDFKKREDEIERSRKEISELQERIKKLVTKRDPGLAPISKQDPNSPAVERKGL